MTKSQPLNATYLFTAIIHQIFSVKLYIALLKHVIPKTDKQKYNLGPGKENSQKTTGLRKKRKERLLERLDKPAGKDGQEIETALKKGGNAVTGGEQEPRQGIPLGGEFVQPATEDECRLLR